MAQTSTENYVRTRTYQDPTTSVISPASVDTYTYVDGLGRTKQTLVVGGERVDYGISNLLNTFSEWTVGVGSTSGYIHYGDEAESMRAIGVGPFGHHSPLWRAGSDETDAGYDDGGFTGSWIEVDHNFAHRFVVWVKKDVLLGAKTYFGTSHVLQLDGTPVQYAYFEVAETLPSAEWYLFVGVVHSSTYAGGNTEVSGVYDVQGNKILDGTEFKFPVDQANTRNRIYNAYQNTPGYQYFFQPMIHKLDGTEPSLESLFESPKETQSDIVTPVVYDVYGRQTMEYLPYPAETQQGAIHADPLTAHADWYTTHSNTPNPYLEKVLEASPLSRILEQGAPGAAWQADPSSDTDHTIKFEYNTNAEDEVKRYHASTTPTVLSSVTTYDPTLVDQGTYLPGTLYKSIIKDENWQPGDDKLHTVEDFKNTQGQVVLKRTYADLPGEPQTAHDTYYIHDNFGNLTYVLPPAVTTGDGVSEDELDEFSYQYVYDHRNRLVEKKLPGKDWEFIVYNKLDQPVLTQDPNLQEGGQWLFTKYDQFGRVTYTGIFTDPSDRIALQNQLNGETIMYETYVSIAETIAGEQVNYDNQAYPTANLNLYTISYYDTYNFPNAATPVESYGETPDTNVKGLATGVIIRVLETDDYLTTISFYNQKGQVISTVVDNPYQGSTETMKNQLDFTGQTMASETILEKSGETIVQTRTFQYDARKQLVSTLLSINGGPAREIANNTYDELGQLASKGLHGSGSGDYVETIDYNYNVRGWLTGIDDAGQGDYFSMQLSYDEGPTPLYNGNISRWDWESNGNGEQTYDYTYDALSRITSGAKAGGAHSLNTIAYDKMGNIQSLVRTSTGGSIIDGLSYTYTGNQLLTVSDASDQEGFNDGNTTGYDYFYDLNGNLTEDKNKDIVAISYSHLNLPTQVSFQSGDQINYTYDAAGIKLRKEVIEGEASTTTDYLGSLIYENDALQLIQHEEGRLVPVIASDGEAISDWDYQYHLKDHLGNVRLTFSTTPENYTITETFETGEDHGFQDLHRHVSATANTTEGGDEVSLLQSGQTGALILVGMNKGDTINLSAKANYEAAPTGNTFLGTAYNALFASFDNVYGGAEGIMGDANAFDNALGGVDMSGKTNVNTAPRAFLNYIFFDAEMNYVRAGFAQISAAADGLEAHETISIENILADQEGYILAYLSNENQEAVNIHFDDFAVYHGKTDVVQTDDYYPFGLSYNSTSRTASTSQNYKYNGKELQEELGLNWHDYGARNYNATLGRWKNIDPLAEKMSRHSPYDYGFDNPIRFVDPDGRAPISIQDPPEEYHGPGFAIGDNVVNILDEVVVTPEMQYARDNGKKNINGIELGFSAALPFFNIFEGKFQMVGLNVDNEVFIDENGVPRNAISIGTATSKLGDFGGGLGAEIALTSHNGIHGNNVTADRINGVEYSTTADFFFFSAEQGYNYNLKPWENPTMENNALGGGIGYQIGLIRWEKRTFVLPSVVEAYKRVGEVRERHFEVTGKMIGYGLDWKH